MKNNFIKKTFFTILVLIINWFCLLYYDSIESRNDIIFALIVGIIPLISIILLFKIYKFKKEKYFYSRNILLFFTYLLTYFLMIRFFGKSTYYYELYTIMFVAIPLAVIGLLTFYKESYK